MYIKIINKEYIMINSKKTYKDKLKSISRKTRRRRTKENHREVYLKLVMHMYSERNQNETSELYFDQMRIGGYKEIYMFEGCGDGEKIMFIMMRTEDAIIIYLKKHIEYDVVEKEADGEFYLEIIEK